MIDWKFWIFAAISTVLLLAAMWAATYLTVWSWAIIRVIFL